MDEQERKKYFSLPPDYVTIGMLRERWLQKQEEEKLKEKQEQEVLQETQNFEKDCKNQPHGEMDFIEGVGKVGGEMDFIEEREKGKEKMGWSGDSRIMNKRNYHSKNKKYGKKKNGDIDTEKMRNPRPKEGLDLVEKKNGSKGVEIILKNKEKVGIAGFPCGESSGTQGIGKRVNVGMIEVLPKNRAREGSSQISTALDVRRDGFSGGFRSEENDHWDEGFCGKEHGVKLKELKDNNSLGKKMEDEVLQIDRKGNGRTRGRRRHHGNNFKQSGAEMSGLKLNEVELKSKDEISEIGNERDRMKGTGRNDVKHNSVNGEVLAADTLVLENKVEDTVLAEKDRNDGFRGYGYRRGNLRQKFENLTIDDRKGPYMGSKVERKFGGNSRHVKSGRLKVDWNMKQSKCGMVWVKKERSGAVGGEACSMGASPDE
ncbi:uncharacterized protein [Primulina huaijiensis]|uniref:uncharacterized protein isoform X1 n=1 Tax=Primulina huaijiensis TaxID=1492673 RepID=UPI003CC70F17